MTARKILEISSYPPPHAGWGVRVKFLKQHLEASGHECVVLNIGPSRAIPSEEYETVTSGVDYVRKIWRFTRAGFVPHMHANGASPKGLILALVAESIALLCGRRSFLTFHAGVNQIYFPRAKYPLLVPAFWALFRLSRAVICNSEAVKAKIVEYGVPPSKVFPIPAFSPQYLETAIDPLPPDIEAFFATYAHVVFCYMKMRPVFWPYGAVDTFARLAARHPNVGLLLCGVEGDADPGIWPAVQARLAEPDLRTRVLVVADLPHKTFLRVLGRSTLYLRTPDSDGVCSSVLEALSMSVPVVAVENHSRPQGVLTYPPEDSDAMLSLVEHVITRREEVVAGLCRPELRDTLTDEVALLTA